MATDHYKRLRINKKEFDKFNTKQRTELLDKQFEKIKPNKLIEFLFPKRLSSLNNAKNVLKNDETKERYDFVLKNPGLKKIMGENVNYEILERFVQAKKFVQIEAENENDKLVTKKTEQLFERKSEPQQRNDHQKTSTPIKSILKTSDNSTQLTKKSVSFDDIKTVEFDDMQKAASVNKTKEIVKSIGIQEDHHISKETRKHEEKTKSDLIKNGTDNNKQNWQQKVESQQNSNQNKGITR